MSQTTPPPLVIDSAEEDCLADSEQDRPSENELVTEQSNANMSSRNSQEDDEMQYPSPNQGASYQQTRISPPITLLQEICSRNGFTPEYQLLSTEGSVHEPTFKIAVTVDDITVTASGQSKKKARHAAAKEAIEKLRQRKELNFDGINFESMAPIVDELVSTSKAPSSYSIAINEANPVGKLQEICMKMRVNPPDYNTCDEKGLAHERIFVLSCSIMGPSGLETTLGQGRSKKLAKREAAEKMLIKLENAGIYDKTENVKSHELRGPAGHGVPNAGSSSQSNSLNIDSDDSSNLIRARMLMNELGSRLDYTIEQLDEEIHMIEMDTVNPDLYYELFSELMANIDYKFDFEYVTDNHALLQIRDSNNTIVMTSSGTGDDLIAAMKRATLSAYRIFKTIKNPLTVVVPLQSRQAAMEV